MKTQTPEQIAARDAKRERFKQLVKQIAAMSDTDRARIATNAGTVLTCEGKALSPINTCLLFLQCPNVSMVGGFRQWLRQGRCVRKGQHGSTIWIPLGARGGDIGADLSGQESVESMRFGTATVFDISQTEELQAAATESAAA